MTDAHRRVFQEMWPVFGLSLTPCKLDQQQTFGRVAPLTLEIGFGDGRSLLSMALDNPQQDFIGIEVYRNGIAKLLAGIKKYNLTNVRVFCADAIEVLNNCISDASLQQVQLFFPDPWPKKRHFKRRIVQQEFIDLISRKLVLKGYFHMATDWENYAQQVLELMGQQQNWLNAAGVNNYSIRPITRPLTKFEQRGQRLGHGTWDLIFSNCGNI